MYISMWLVAAAFAFIAYIRDEPSPLIVTGIILFIKLSLIKVVLACVGAYLFWEFCLKTKNGAKSMFRRRAVRVNKTLYVNEKPIKQVKEKCSETWYSDEIEKLVGSVKK